MSIEAAEVVKKTKHRDSYYTYDVVEVTDKEITLQRTKKNKEVVTAIIEKERRPYLQVGDRVRDGAILKLA